MKAVLDRVVLPVLSRSGFWGVSIATIVGAMLLVNASANAQTPVLKPDVEEWVLRMEKEHQFDAVELRTMLSTLKPNQKIIKAIGAPATSRPWHYFHKLYVTDSRINGGVEFWNEHQKLLERARAAYGVPEEIVTAIIAVESVFGKRTGTFQVADALYTLGFEVPRRSSFFKGQFEHFMLLARENGFEPLDVKGSFAGAMGIPQFIPSSYRDYAIDFDEDGRVDLWNSVADAVGSVANYLSRFGWREGEPVVVRANVSGGDSGKLESLGVKPSLTMSQFRERGVEPLDSIADDVDGGFFILEGENEIQHWISLNNFYVITRYNRSKNYAMAVYQLSQEISAKRKEQITVLESAEKDN